MSCLYRANPGGELSQLKPTNKKLPLARGSLEPRAKSLTGDARSTGYGLQNAENVIRLGTPSTFTLAQITQMYRLAYASPY